jgi:hypothetical protein
LFNFKITVEKMKIIMYKRNKRLGQGERERERERETSRLRIAFSRTQNVASGTVPVWLTRNVQKELRKIVLALLGHYEQLWGSLYKVSYLTKPTWRVGGWT